MGDTFFRKNNLEDKITNSNLPDSVPNETINLEEYYAELGTEMRRDFYDSEFGKKWNSLYERLNINEYLDIIGIDDLYSTIGRWGNKILGEIDWQQFMEYGATPLVSAGAFTAGSLLCYVTNLK